MSESVQDYLDRLGSTKIPAQGIGVRDPSGDIRPLEGRENAQVGIPEIDDWSDLVGMELPMRSGFTIRIRAK